MAILGPAIAALRSGDVHALRAFDDLLFSADGQSLVAALKGTPAPDSEPGEADDEFEDIPDPAKGGRQPPTGRAGKKTGKGKAVSTPVGDIDLPVENPLQR